MRTNFVKSTPSFALACLLAGCGGGDPDPVAEPLAIADDSHVGALGVNALTISINQRAAAARAAANNGSNACAPIRPFYWEVGSAGGRATGGSVNSSTDPKTYTASTPMSLASASKWLYAAYVAQRRNGQLNAGDIKLLTLRGGYDSLDRCLTNQTVDSCLAFQNNGLYTAAADGSFFYNGGHMQEHASLLGLGALNNKSLVSEMQSQLGTEVTLNYSQPQVAGGAYATPAAYAKVLRKILGGQLKIGALLGSNKACASLSACGAGEALYTPVPANLSWHYSIGHWVEDDPITGDGAFSSAGAGGFYPWVDASRTYYGIVARSVTTPSAGNDSAMCGQLIRKAWISGGSAS